MRVLWSHVLVGRRLPQNLNCVWRRRVLWGHVAGLGPGQPGRPQVQQQIRVGGAKCGCCHSSPGALGADRCAGRCAWCWRCPVSWRDLDSTEAFTQGGGRSSMSCWEVTLFSLGTGDQKGSPLQDSDPGRGVSHSKGHSV
jgi:hypothetical protein